MSISSVWPQILDFFGTPLVAEPSAGPLSSDAGLLPFRPFDAGVGLTQAFADVLDDPRDPDLAKHTFPEMVRSRVHGILADYEDQNDHDTLRHDPVFRLLAGRSPEDDDLAMDRLGDHRFVANSFRLYLHAAARNLLVRLRRFIAEPLPVPAPHVEAAGQPGEAVDA
jgi:hypothetical protein